MNTLAPSSNRSTRRRRFVAGLLLALVLALLASNTGWLALQPSPLVEAFGRIKIGMRTSEARHILGAVPGLDSPMLISTGPGATAIYVDSSGVSLIVVDDGEVVVLSRINQPSLFDRLHNWLPFTTRIPCRLPEF